MEASKVRVPYNSVGEDDTVARVKHKNEEKLNHRIIFSKPKEEHHKRKEIIMGRGRVPHKFDPSINVSVNQSHVIFCKPNTTNEDRDSRLWYIDTPSKETTSSRGFQKEEKCCVQTLDSSLPESSLINKVQPFPDDSTSEIDNQFPLRKQSVGGAVLPFPRTRKLSGSLRPLLPVNVAVLDNSTVSAALSSSSLLPSSAPNFLPPSCIQASSLSLSSSLQENNLHLGIVSMRPHYQPLNPIRANSPIMNTEDSLSSIRSQFLSMKNDLARITEDKNNDIVRKTIGSIDSLSSPFRDKSIGNSSEPSLIQRSDSCSEPESFANNEVLVSTQDKALPRLSKNSLAGKRTPCKIDGDPSSPGNIASMAAAFAGAEVNNSFGSIVVTSLSSGSDSRTIDTVDCCLSSAILCYRTVTVMKTCNG